MPARSPLHYQCVSQYITLQASLSTWLCKGGQNHRITKSHTLRYMKPFMTPRKQLRQCSKFTMSHNAQQLIKRAQFLPKSLQAQNKSLLVINTESHYIA